MLFALSPFTVHSLFTVPCCTLRVSWKAHSCVSTTRVLVFRTQHVESYNGAVISRADWVRFRTLCR